ncbi:MAG TPA: hypothetical protein EYP17_04665 [Candidatus Latescibacteria bacterium]|nr:hypothetical protein [Candidatus Latescibacterota bacterium]
MRYMFPIALVLVVGCGGKGGTMRPGVPEDGRIFLDNRTEFTITASYFGEEGGTVETVVEAHQKKEISRAPLKGGTEVKVHLKSTREAGGFGPQIPETDVEVTVDGNIVIVVYRVGIYGNPRAWEYYVITQ